MPSLVFTLLLSLLSIQTSDIPPRPLSPFPPAFSFVGPWSCTGTMRGGKTHGAKFSGSLAVGGKWLLLSEVDLEPSTGYEATYLIGYDATTRGLVEFDANNSSAAVYRSSVGWHAGTLTMESQEPPLPGHSYFADRFVYSITGTDFTVEWQVTRSHNSDWLTADHLLCKGAKAAS
jgi:hypothetical protein